MIGSKNELEAVNELIDTLDIPKVDVREIRQYEIEHVGAEEVENTLIQLGIISKSSSSSSAARRATTSTTRPPTSTARTTTTTPQSSMAPASGKEFEDEPQVVVLAPTNSLLVNATPEQHDQISMIAAFVDKKDDKAANPYVIYSLENQDPEMMAETLTKGHQGNEQNCCLQRSEAQNNNRPVRRR